MSWLQNQQLTTVCVGFILWMGTGSCQPEELCHLHYGKQDGGPRAGDAAGWRKCLDKGLAAC